MKVQLQDGAINISVEDEPRVVAGKRSLRGEAAALRAVKDHKMSPLKEWHATRPDDQKLAKNSEHCSAKPALIGPPAVNLGSAARRPELFV
ncbi:hypothetical protein [Mesorhizobium sp. B4-1-4]|uniref:hypothetical protein n=1 Tax=Mesorhizobium sp. B4-1-4 TaxID=2589888 RepID=UPI0039AFB4BF